MATKRFEKFIPWIYCLPGVLIMGLFILLPIILSFVMSFFSIESLGAAWEFTGFDNFASIFRENDFFLAFLRTLGFGAFSMVTSLFFGLLLALLVAKHRMLGFYRYVFYLPAVVSAITMGKLWNLMLMPNETGLLNIIAAAFGAKEPINWLGDANVAYLMVMGIGLIGCGGGMTFVLFTTAINEVPQEYLEAASLEGANALQRSLFIVIPNIRPVLSSWMLLSIISSFKSFEFIFALTGGGPASSTTTLAILLYNNSLTNASGYGAASAMGFLLTIIVMVFTVGYLVLTRERKEA